MSEYDGFGMGWGGMGIGMVFFWGIIIAGIMALVRAIGGASHGGEPRLPEKTPLDVIGERYARSEIDMSEFENKRRDLEQSGTMLMDKQQSEFLKAAGVEAS